MNPLLLSAIVIGSGGILSLLIHLLVFALIIWLVVWIVGMFPLPPVVKNIIFAILGIVTLIWLLNLLGVAL